MENTNATVPCPLCGSHLTMLTKRGFNFYKAVLFVPLGWHGRNELVIKCLNCGRDSYYIPEMKRAALGGTDTGDYSEDLSPATLAAKQKANKELYARSRNRDRNLRSQAFADDFRKSTQISDKVGKFLWGFVIFLILTVWLMKDV